MKIKIFIICITVLFVFGCKKPSKVRNDDIKGIKSSSTLKDSKNRYLVKHLIDKKEASWCEGKKGYGVGEIITVHLKKEAAISEIYVLNGYGSSEYYRKNSRIKSFQVSTENSDKLIVEIKDSTDPEKIKLPKTIYGKILKLQIKSVYRGSKWDDTCLTEISFSSINIQIKPSKLTIGYLLGKNFEFDTLKSKSPCDIFGVGKDMKFSCDPGGCGDSGCEKLMRRGTCKKINNGKGLSCIAGKDFNFLFSNGIVKINGVVVELNPIQ